MDTSIISGHPAGKAGVGVLPVTFMEFRDRLLQTSNSQIQYRDATPVKLQPDSKYSLISLKLSEYLSAEQFMLVFGGIAQVIQQLTESGALPDGLLQGVSTIMDIETPAMPEQFTDCALELTGHIGIIPRQEDEITD